MTDQAKVLDRTRKVLALAEGTNNMEEAALMMNKVHAMLREHNVTLLDVAQADTVDPVDASREAAYCWISNSWVKKVASALARLYGCQMVTQQQGNKLLMSIVGRQSARVTWEVMLPFVVAQVKSEARADRDSAITDLVAATGWDWDRASKHSRVKGIGAYERAVGNALVYRINGMARENEYQDSARVKAGERALVPVDMVEHALIAAFPNLRMLKARTLSTTSQAVASAQRVSLHHQTTASAGTLKIGK